MDIEETVKNKMRAKGFLHAILTIVCIIIASVIIKFTLYDMAVAHGIGYLFRLPDIFALFMFPGIPLLFPILFGMGSVRFAKKFFRLGRDGKIYHGVITGHSISRSEKSPDVISGLEVNYKERGHIKNAFIPCKNVPVSTGANKTYPVNSCIAFLMVPGTGYCEYIQAIPDIKDKEELVLRNGEVGFGATGTNMSSGKTLRRKFIVCACPKCGAEIQIANHGTATCQYCGQFISYDDDSEEEDMYDVTVQGLYGGNHSKNSH